MDKKSDDGKAGLQRRRFLLSLGAGSATGAAAAVAATTGRAAPEAAAAVKTAAAEAREQGVSEHARGYYRSARI